MKTRKNLQNTLFIAIIFIILVSPLVYWLLPGINMNENSSLEERELSAFPALSFRDFKTAVKRILQRMPAEAGEIFFNQFIDGTFRREFDKAASEQMFMRLFLVEYARLFDRANIKGAYLPLPDQAFPASMNGSIYVTRDGENLLQDPLYFTEQEKEAVDARIENYRELLQKFPDIRFYVFDIETLPHSTYHPVAPYFPQADNGRSLQYFRENKPEDLRFENFALTGFDDYRESFFKTDQHWKIGAAVQAYEQIYAMLREEYPDISPMIEFSPVKKIEGLDFLGALARKALFPIEPDILEYVDADIPPYDTYVNGELATYGGRDEYLQGIYDPDKYFNHYRGFYGSAQVNIHYHFDNDTDRNLLMIVSSHSRMIQMYLASHYRDAYVIDMRYEENSSKSLQEYIGEYEITDVLVLGQPLISYYSTDYAILP
jgi:hypothetical protein